jgi:hypothetical protein
MSVIKSRSICKLHLGRARPSASMLPFWEITQ